MFDKTRGNLDGGISRGNFPELNEIEFRVLYTERVTTYMALINNDLNRESKRKSAKKKNEPGKATKNVYDMITRKKPLFRVKKKEPKNILTNLNLSQTKESSD